MKKACVFMFAAVAVAMLNAATINQVIVRQQWPWSTKVKVEYSLSGVDASHPVDIAVTTYNGDVELPSTHLGEAIEGDVYGVTEEFGEFYIDPVVAYGTEKIGMTKFKVKLAVTDSAANINEVLYKIYDLTSGECTDVTRADLFNGKYGTYETNYTALGSGFTTPLNDVLIWTGVTNDAKYATTHLVLRKIPAKGQTFAMGSPEGEIGRQNMESGWTGDGQREMKHSVSFTNDFYMGVFEVTQSQWNHIKNDWPSTWSLADCRDTRPVESVSYDTIRGNMSTVGGAWPTNLSHEAASSSFLGMLRSAITDSPKFDLPTEAQWEYACRAKSTTAYYNGKDCENGANNFTSPNFAGLGRYRWSGGYVDGAYPQSAHYSTVGDTNGTARVGSYLPNAWGLYDMLGNVAEWCLDWYDGFTADSITEPTGPERADAFKINGYEARVLKGAAWYSPAYDCRAAIRFHKTWSQGEAWMGFRICITITD